MEEPKGTGDRASPMDRFKWLVRAPRRIRGLSLRDPDGANVEVTGLIELNVGATERMDETAMAKGLDPYRYSVLLGGDVDAKQVGVALVDPNTPGATAVRRDADKRVCTLYANELFQDQPQLRPASRRWCVITREPDGAGGHFFIIHLSVSLERRVIRRKPSTQPPGQEAGQ